MRPYQITPNGEWVDLDTIQSIQLVKSVGRIRVQWRHAFQDKPRDIFFDVPLSDPLANDKDSQAYAAETDQLVDQVFTPFFKAWSGDT